MLLAFINNFYQSFTDLGIADIALAIIALCFSGFSSLTASSQISSLSLHYSIP
jgi:hypothetical protein